MASLFDPINLGPYGGEYPPPCNSCPQRTTCKHGRKATDAHRTYSGEYVGVLYRERTMRRLIGIPENWRCSMCGVAEAKTWDHCHEHMYVRAPLCLTCNSNNLGSSGNRNFPDEMAAAEWADMHHPEWSEYRRRTFPLGYATPRKIDGRVSSIRRYSLDYSFLAYCFEFDPNCSL